MTKAVWARKENRKQLYLMDETCAFIPSVKRYLDYLAALEKSPHTARKLLPPFVLLLHLFRASSA